MRPCPYPGCTAQIPAHQFACRNHWFALDPGLRAGITRAWRQIIGAASEEATKAALDRHSALTAEAQTSWAATEAWRGAHNA